MSESKIKSEDIFCEDLKCFCEKIHPRDLTWSVGDKVVLSYDNKEYEVAKVNDDGTIRLKCDDTNHPNYNDGTIGCFSPRSVKMKIKINT
jgi:hypothetical protein